MNHTEQAQAHTRVYPQYRKTEERAKPILILRNIGRRGQTWIRRGDTTIGYFDSEGRLHFFSALLYSWCICTKPKGKWRTA